VVLLLTGIAAVVRLARSPEHPPPAGQGVLVQFAGPLVLTQPGQVDGEVVHRPGQGRQVGIPVELGQYPVQRHGFLGGGQCFGFLHGREGDVCR